MLIRSNTAIQNNYSDIASLCKTTGEPIYLTEKGEGELVVMALDAFERKAFENSYDNALFELKSELLEARSDKFSNKTQYLSLDQMMVRLDNIIEQYGMNE